MRQLDAQADWPVGLPALATAAPLSGGMICTALDGRLADGRRVVVKRCPYRVDVEAEGLRALAAAGAPVPGVLGVSRRTLVVEHVGGIPDWAALGRAIAAFHRTTAERYGWARNNQDGRLTQDNTWAENWPTFFIERRVRPHLAAPEVPDELRRRLLRACDGPLPALLPAEPPASLTHGDLWAGNIVAGRWLIDPAVCYADRELDLAYLELAGRVPSELLAGYADEWPLDPGYEQRRPVLQLHKLLVHVRHFGAKYVPQVAVVLDRYGW
jgi:fructosamine-3-kinase